MKELRRRLAILADAAKYDASCASSGSNRPAQAGGLGNTEGMGICHSYTPDGRCVSLLKLLLTNHCIYDCQYCINRISSDVERARFTPAEVAALTVQLYRRNCIEGLFLSSGVLKNADYTMELLVQTARLLREEHAFHGYIHLKAVPGASPELYTAAGRYADRLSANIELASDAELQRLAPGKEHAQVERAMRAIASSMEELPEFAPAGQSTQMIVGATPASDRSMLETASALYSRHALRRVYYSAYSPIPHEDPRLPAAPPPLVREHRLYQADWLMRHYGFAAGELTQPEQPMLDLEIDPKLAWALSNRASFPVDLNRAPRELLLRVPGLGVRSVDRILRQRRVRAIRYTDLKALRVPLERTAAFVVTADRPAPLLSALDALDLRARLVPARQLELFAEERG